MMREWWLSVIGIVVLGLASDAGAASVGVPTGTEDSRWEVTAEYTHLLDRDMADPSATADELRSGNQAHARVGYLLLPLVQPYIKLGAAEFEERLKNANISGLGLRNITYEYDWGFSVGGGLQGVYEFPGGSGWFVGYDGQYLRSDNDLGGVVHSGRRGSAVSGNVSVEEWHVGGYVGKTFEIGEAKLTGYVGGRWSDLELDIDSTLTYTDAVDGGTVTSDGRTEADDNFGAFVGLSYQASNRWRVAVEGRFLDEAAVTGQVSYTF